MNRIEQRDRKWGRPTFRPRLLPAWLLCAGACAGLLGPALGAEAETKPAPAAAPAPPARIEPAKDETPRQALMRGCKVFDQLDVGRAMELFRYDEKDAKERALAEALCAYAVSATRVEHAVRRKLGDAAAAEVVHSIGENTEADVADAKITVDGDTATVKLPHSAEPAKLVRVAGVWKVPVKDIAAGLTDDDVKTLVESNHRSAAAFDRVSEKVEAGKLKTVEEINEAMDRAAHPPPPQPGEPV